MEAPPVVRAVQVVQAPAVDTVAGAVALEAAALVETASMCSKAALPSIVGQYYANILLLDPSCVPLTTISSRRARWYLEKNLAEALGSDGKYSERLRLTFEPKKRSSNDFLQAILPTQCVVCGAKDGLTLHHVIPMAVKRFFPEGEKNHTRQWCVLVCEAHHLEAERACRPFYEKSLQEAVQATQKEYSYKNKQFYKIIHMMYAQNLAVDNLIKCLTVQELKLSAAVLGSLIVTEQTLGEMKAVTSEIRKLSKERVKEAKLKWGQNYILDNGGIEKVKRNFRDAFLSLNPQFLPEGFLVDYDNLG